MIEKFKQNEHSNIAHVVGVVSGKGGVGKSTVTTALAAELTRRGKKVGILDADITGPSIPKAFGMEEMALSNGQEILPKESNAGVKVISVNLILGDPTQPVLWRGPIVGQAINQFFKDVRWGDLDYLLVDMPPGTGDVALTVFQSLPLDGVVIVSTPQQLVGQIVEKSINMAKLMNIKVLSLVENMSYFICPSCMEKHYIFGESNIDEIAKKHKVENVSKLPFDMTNAESMDHGYGDDIFIKELEPTVKEILELEN